MIQKRTKYSKTGSGGCSSAVGALTVLLISALLSAQPRVKMGAGDDGES